MIKLLSLQVGLPRTIERSDSNPSQAKEWNTGIFKTPVLGAIQLDLSQLAGDGQADLHNHGGPDKAVNAYPSEHYSFWREALGKPEFTAGAFGENFTTQGLLESEICIGDIFEVGQALVQVSQPRQPCWKLAQRWSIKDLPQRVQETGKTGWYFRVLRIGKVEAGCEIELKERPYSQWTISAANAVMYRRDRRIEAAQLLAACPALALSWRETLGLVKG